jgi:hypothetical protein
MQQKWPLSACGCAAAISFAVARRLEFLIGRPVDLPSAKMHVEYID